MSDSQDAHYGDLKGYTFPVVSKIIDKIGPPPALRRIKQPRQSKLLATLALQLARSCQIILFRGRRTRIDERHKIDLLQKHGERKYSRLKARGKVLGRKYVTTCNELEDLYKDAKNFGADLQPLIGSIYGRNIYKLTWNEAPEQLSHFLESISIRERRAARLEAQLIDLRPKIEDLESKIESSEAYIRDFEQIRWRHLTVDDDQTSLLSHLGRRFIHRDGDLRWWIDFTNRFYGQLKQDALNAPYKIALRDPDVLREIGWAVADNPKWDAAAAEYLASRRSEWGRKAKPPKLGTIRRIRERLRKVDRVAMAWLKLHGVPDNFYTSWFVEQGLIPKISASRRLEIAKRRQRLNLELDRCFASGNEPAPSSLY